MSRRRRYDESLWQWLTWEPTQFTPQTRGIQRLVPGDPRDGSPAKWTITEDPDAFDLPDDEFIPCDSFGEARARLRERFPGGVEGTRRVFGNANSNRFLVFPKPLANDLVRSVTKLTHYSWSSVLGYPGRATLVVHDDVIARLERAAVQEDLWISPELEEVVRDFEEFWDSQLAIGRAGRLCRVRYDPSVAKRRATQTANQRAAAVEASARNTATSAISSKYTALMSAVLRKTNEAAKRIAVPGLGQIGANPSYPQEFPGLGWAYNHFVGQHYRALPEWSDMVTTARLDIAEGRSLQWALSHEVKGWILSELRYPAEPAGEPRPVMHYQESWGRGRIVQILLRQVNATLLYCHETASYYRLRFKFKEPPSKAFVTRWRRRYGFTSDVPYHDAVGTLMLATDLSQHWIVIHFPGTDDILTTEDLGLDLAAAVALFQSGQY